MIRKPIIKYRSKKTGRFVKLGQGGKREYYRDPVFFKKLKRIKNIGIYENKERIRAAREDAETREQESIGDDAYRRGIKILKIKSRARMRRIRTVQRKGTTLIVFKSNFIDISSGWDIGSYAAKKYNELRSRYKRATIKMYQTISYFDPDGETFRTIETKADFINVEKGKSLVAPKRAFGLTRKRISTALKDTGQFKPINSDLVSIQFRTKKHREQHKVIISTQITFEVITKRGKK